MSAEQSRKTDESAERFARREKELPAGQVSVAVGTVLIPEKPVAMGAVVASTVVVTLFDAHKKRGGLCHFARPRPVEGEAPTAMHGVAATLALVRGFLEGGSQTQALKAGIYGGASPAFATAEQRKLAQENVAVARDILKRKNVALIDEDVGGDRGRKLVFVSGSNEVAVLKTDAIRQADWFF